MNKDVRDYGERKRRRETRLIKKKAYVEYSNETN